MSIFNPRLRIISAFVLTYFLVFVSASIYTLNYEFMMYEAQIALILAIVYSMDKRVQFSQLVLWMLTLWGFFHLAGGIIPIPDSLADMKAAGEGDKTQVLYNFRPIEWLPRYDHYIHAFGFATCTLAAFEAMKAHFGKAFTFNTATAAAAFLIALGLGAVNELIEFAAVMLIPDTNVGGYENTGWDLVSNTVGAALALLYLKTRSPSET